jgi:hypothetical protein
MEKRNQRVVVTVALVVLIGLCVLGVPGVQAEDRYQNALGLAIGLNKDEVSAEKMYLINYRIGVLGHDENASYEDNAAGFLQPEVFYWKRNLADFSSTSLAQLRPDSDLAFGLNALMVYAERSVNLFFGVGLNVHHLTNVTDEKTKERGDENRLGGNVQCGVELPLSKTFGLWGAGRWEIIQGSSDVIDTNQVQIYGGLSIRF